jgi:hypothetical protein
VSVRLATKVDSVSYLLPVWRRGVSLLVLLMFRPSFQALCRGPRGIEFSGRSNRSVQAVSYKSSQIRGPFPAGTLAHLSQSQRPFVLSVPSLPLNV